MENNSYKKIPSVNKILEHENIISLDISRKQKVEIIREHLQEIRQNIQNEKCDFSEIVQDVLTKLHQQFSSSLQRCINATGILLHTGLGRAPLSKKVIAESLNELKGYVNVEIDCKTGKRSHRDDHTKNLLCNLTKAEDATIVNNNAAAVLVSLSTIAHNKEIIVSCGQLVEIGGSFRIPEIIKQSGAILRIVGCTNKTHLSDYQKAINDNTAAILHVHTSNYKIAGFTYSPSILELAQLAQKNNILFMDDAGSGVLDYFGNKHLQTEPLISNSIGYGADIVTFSGDKLLGACQAGIIVGKKDIIEKIRKNPLLRAFRVDKITILILQKTLLLYQKENVQLSNPILRMLTCSTENIAIEICDKLQCKTEYDICVKKFPSYAGSGALPTQEIASYAVAICSQKQSVTQISQILRENTPPVFTVVKNNTLFIAPRSLLEGEVAELISILLKIL